MPATPTSRRRRWCKDLKQRGLLDDTLVIWGGEFGRTPFLQGDIDDRKRWGRDHHPYAFTLWMAGGGVKPGITYGETDDFGHERRRATRSTSTTSRRRCCTCWASTTSG